MVFIHVLRLTLCIVSLQISQDVQKYNNELHDMLTHLALDYQQVDFDTFLKDIQNAAKGGILKLRDLIPLLRIKMNIHIH